jgi:myosin heavy subunit
MNQKKFFDQDHHALTPSSPMHQQQRQDYSIYGGAQGRNGHLTDERDTSMPVPSRFGTSIQSHLSPRNRNHCSSPSGNPYPHGDAGQLQGVWNVFDSVTFELGKELHDCLSNKAIFEACVVQEQSHHQGKRFTNAEKNEEASLRKTKYENALTITLNRQKGLFSNAVLAAKKEIQNTIDRRVAEVEMRFARQHADMERSYAKRISDREEYLGRQLETKAEDFKREIRRMQNECEQAESANQRLQNDMSIQRQTLTQSLHAAEKGREAAVTELTSTLETLKSTCASAHNTEMKLREVERDLCELQTQHQLESDRATEAWSMENERANLLQQTLEAEVKTNQILRSAQEEMKHVISVEQEHSELLQHKLDEETLSKEEIAQSLQDTCQNLEQVNRENIELREQVAQVSTLQNALSETIKSLRASKQEFDQLSEEFDSCQESLEHTSEENSMLVEKVSVLESQVKDASEKNSMLVEKVSVLESQVKDASEKNSMLVEKVSALESQVEDQMLDLQAAEMSVSALESQVEDQMLDLQAARMSESDVEAALEKSMTFVAELTTKLNDSESSLQKSLEHVKKLIEEEHSNHEALKQAKAENEKLQQANSSLRKERDGMKSSVKKLQEEINNERNQIASALEGFDEEMASAETRLRSVQKELEEEKGKVKLLQLPLQEVTKKMEDEITALKEEKESGRVKFEKEASVYNEAIKMLQKQVDLLQGLVDAGCEKCSRTDEDTSNEVHDVKLVKELEEMLKERDDHINHLEEKCLKREESMVMLEKLCAKARDDLLTLRNEKKDLELAVQRYASMNAIVKCDDGTSKAVNELFGPIIDAAPSMNDIDDMINKGEKEFHNIMTYVGTQIGAGVASCGEYGVECTLNEPDHHTTRRHQDRGREQDNGIIFTNSW